MVRSGRVLLTWDETHGFIFGQLLLASFEFFGHFLMLSALSKSLEVVVDGAVQLVFDAARTRLEVARSTGLYIATKLIRKSVNELTFNHMIVAYLLLPAVIARALNARLVLALGYTRGRILHQPIPTAVVHTVVGSEAPLPLPGRAISNDRALARGRGVLLEGGRDGRERLMRRLHAAPDQRLARVDGGIKGGAGMP